MSTPIERRRLIEAIDIQSTECDSLLRVIAQLGQGHDQEFVVNVFAIALAESPVEMDDCVLFRNIAAKFDIEGRLIDVFKVVPGTTERAEVVIGSSTDP